MTSEDFLTDFWCDIDGEFGDPVIAARIELARRGWKRSSDTGLVVPAPAETPAAPTPSVSCYWFREGDAWRIRVPSRPELPPLKDCVGLRYIWVLLQAPGKELSPIRVLSLAGSENLAKTASLEDITQFGESDHERFEAIYDEQALRKFHDALKFIEQELEEARANNDPTKAEVLMEQKEEILEKVRLARGKNNRPRKMKSEGGTASNTVSRGIKRALIRISKEDPASGKFLEQYIKRGSKLSYIGANTEWKV